MWLRRAIMGNGKNVFLIKHEISMNDKHCVLLSIIISYSFFSAPLSCITDIGVGPRTILCFLQKNSFETAMKTNFQCIRYFQTQHSCPLCHRSLLFSGWQMQTFATNLWETCCSHVEALTPHPHTLHSIMSISGWWQKVDVKADSSHEH